MSGGGFYTWHVGTLRDGKLTTRIPVTPQSAWSLNMDDAGTITAVTVLSDPQVQELNLRVAAEPARCFLAVAYTDPDGNETFLEAGPIWSHSWDADSKRLTIAASGLWSLWDHRMVLPVLTAGQTAGEVTTTAAGLSLGTIAKRLVQLAALHTGGSVPVVLPADEAGSESRVWPGYSMARIGDELRSLTQLDNGPEIQFRPRRQAADPNRLEWVMRTGTAGQPLLVQTGQDWVWDLTVVRGSASKLTQKVDASAMAGRVWEVGSGSDTETLTAMAEDTDLITAGYPLLEVSDQGHAGEDAASDQAALDSYAAAALRLARRPASTFGFTMQRDGTPNVGALSIGDYARLSMGDEYVPAGQYRARITQLASSGVDQVTVQLATIEGDI